VKPGEQREVDAAPEAEGPTKEQFARFASHLIAVPKAEYDELEAKRRASRKARGDRPNAP
jgi:hypothetical protein